MLKSHAVSIRREITAQKHRGLSSDMSSQKKAQQSVVIGLV